MATEQQNIVFTIEFTDTGVIHKINGIKNSVKKFDKELKIAATSSKKLGMSLREDMTTNAGLAGATITELGRTISDSNYGIRGMANNLSQLSTLFITMVSKVDGSVKGLARVGRAFKMLGAQIMGPLGFILLFQIVIQQMEKASMASKNLGGNLDDLQKKLAANQALIVNLRQAANTIEQVGEKSADGKIALAALKKEGYDPLIGSVREFIAVKGVLLKVTSKEEDDAKKNIKDVILRLRAAQKELETLEGKSDRQMALHLLKTGVSRMFGGDFEMFKKGKSLESILKNQIGAMEAALAIANNTLEDMGEESRRIIESSPYLDALLGGKTDKNKESAVAKIIKKTLNSIKILTAEGDKELLIIAKESALEEIELAEGTEKEKARAKKLIIKKFLIEVDILVLEQAKEEAEKVAEIWEDAVKSSDKAGKKRDTERKKRQDTVLFNLRNNIKELNKMQQAVNQLFSSLASVLTSLNDIQQEFHQANIDRINREKDLVLQNDSITQQEKEKRLREIESREIAAEKRKIKAERDMFTLQQTIAIAKAFLDLKLYNQRMLEEGSLLAMSATKAQIEVEVESAKDVSSSIGTIPTFIKSLGPIVGPIAYGVSIVGMIAAIVKARKAAKNAIANLVPTASASGGGGASIQAPAFNVVGATETSQLAQAMGGQEEKPIKAFVVASDVSTAQELERSAIEGSSIG